MHNDPSLPADGGGLSRSTRRTPLLGWLLPIGFGVVAVGLFATSRNFHIPVEPVVKVDPAALVVGPRRTALTDPAHIMVEGRPQTCNGCHQIFDSASPAGAELSYHQEIRLSHGLNNRCVNCHDPGDRERLTLRDGATVPFAQTPQLCAQCHGTVYRDWERGTHGKTLGSWITGSEAQRRLSCNECHDPHAPKYDAYTPMPGPRTLHMGSPSAGTDHEPTGKQSPLQRWLAHPHAHTDEPGRSDGQGGHP